MIVSQIWQIRKSFFKTFHSTKYNILHEFPKLRYKNESFFLTMLWHFFEFVHKEKLQRDWSSSTDVEKVTLPKTNLSLGH